jgi:tRNA-binding EMAP/Myf-like protein
MDTINFEQFEAVDIRMGTVIEAVVPEWSHWVIRMTVDLGPAFAEATAGKRERTCFSGIMKFFKPEDLVGKQFPFVVNLKPRTIGPDKELSEVMMIMACPEDPSKAEAGEETPTVLFQLQEIVANGTKVR